ncbi:MAG: hypothetical protein K6346_03995, partial [Halothiobacillaceae bacterium]
ASGTTDPKNTGNPIYYRWSQLSGPTVNLINSDAQKASFVAPSVTTATDLMFQVSVSREPITSSTVFATSEQAETVVRVNPVATPGPLVASAGPAQTVEPNTSVTLDASGTTDPDNTGRPIYYQWRQVSGPTVVLGNANTPQASFVAPSTVGAELVFEVSVSRAPITSSTVFAPSEQATTTVRVVAAPAS